MFDQKNVSNGAVSKQTLMIVAVVAMVAGFLAGVVFSSINSGPGVATGPPLPGPQQQGGPSLSPEQAGQILSLEQKVAANPANVQAWTQLGHVYFDSGNPPKAIRAYIKSLELSPGNADVLTDLGVMYRRNGEPYKAIESFDKAVATDPAHQIARMNKGIVLHFDLGKTEDAKKVWQTVLEINPDATAPNGQPLSIFMNSL